MALPQTTTELAVATRRTGAADTLRSAAVFDAWADRRFELWRGHRVPDTAAAACSFLGDHGLVWFLAGLVLGRRPGRPRRRAMRAVVFSGLVVPVVNRALKELVGRHRPPPGAGPAPVWVRTPTTTSFPSGHALAAGCAATLLAEDAGPLTVGALAGLAAAVAVSRVHLRHHHASDVVAGAGLGVLLGMTGRRLFPLR